MTYSKDDLLNFKLLKAKESLEEARLLAQNDYWNTVANRLYYSIFYAVSALFVKYDIKTHTHSGTKAEFHKTFIKSNIINKELGYLYSDLFSKRHEGDYEDFLIFTQEDIEPLISQVEEFIIQIENLIAS